MPRDNFTGSTLERLAKRVGSRCSNPDCRRLTTGPHEDPSRSVSIGVAAHITAASPGGPRFDGSLTADERSSAANGIWLCQNCAKLIDSDTTRFTVQTLHDWKASAEAAARTEVDGRTLAGSRHVLSAEINITFKRLRVDPDIQFYRLHVSVTNTGPDPMRQLLVDVEMPALVVHDPGKNRFYRSDRSTDDVAFFRVTPADLPHDLYQGETKPILQIRYFVSDEIHWKFGWVYDRRVAVTLRREGFRSLAVEKTFRDLLL